MIMASGINVFNRMRDVMFALNEAQNTGINPTRIQLQKFIYLTDTLGQIANILKLKTGHKTYLNGPYDSAIQNAVDSLAFRGFVRITASFKTPSGHTATKYALTTSGEELLSKICDSPNLVDKSMLAGLIGKHVSRLGWERIVELVYAEPTFVATRSKGLGTELQVEDGTQASSAYIIAIMKRVFETISDGEEAKLEWLIDCFFCYLNDYSIHYGVKK